jgi:hypothetical protein
LNHLPSFGIYFKNLRSSAKEEKPEISKYKKKPLSKQVLKER